MQSSSSDFLWMAVTRISVQTDEKQRAKSRHEQNPHSRYTKYWQEDRAVAAGVRATGLRGRKVRTPQGSVPDNVRDAGFKARGRPVPQKTYRQPGTVFGLRQGTGPKGSCPDGQSGKGEKVR